VQQGQKWVRKGVETKVPDQTKSCRLGSTKIAGKAGKGRREDRGSCPSGDGGEGGDFPNAGRKKKLIKKWGRLFSKKDGSRFKAERKVEKKGQRSNKKTI